MPDDLVFVAVTEEGAFFLRAAVGKKPGVVVLVHVDGTVPGVVIFVVFKICAQVAA